jgi:hypothetical protein
MASYRRNFVAGGSYCLTVNLAERRLRLLTPDDRKLPDAKARTLDHRHTAPIEGVFRSRKVGEEQSGLTQGPPVGFAPEEVN